MSGQRTAVTVAPTGAGVTGTASTEVVLADAGAVVAVAVSPDGDGRHAPDTMHASRRPTRLSCDDVLDTTDALIWRTVRAARNDSRVQGDRVAAIALAAHQLDLPADEVADRLHAAAILLRRAGVLATMLHWVSHVGTTWVTQSAPRGSRRARAAADDPTSLFFPSARCATNAKLALIIIDTFDPPARATLAAAIRAHLWEPAATPDVVTATSSVAGVVSAAGVTVTVGREHDAVIVTLPGSLPLRSWSGRPMQAAWLADVIERGAIIRPAA